MDIGPDSFCPGCTGFTNNIANLDGLADAGASWANISNMPLAQIEVIKAGRSTPPTDRAALGAESVSGYQQVTWEGLYC